MSYPIPTDSGDADHLYKEAMFFYHQYEKMKRRYERSNRIIRSMNKMMRGLKHDLKMFIENGVDDWLNNHHNTDDINVDRMKQIKERYEFLFKTGHIDAEHDACMMEDLYNQVKYLQAKVRK